MPGTRHWSEPLHRHHGWTCRALAGDPERLSCLQVFCSFLSPSAFTFAADLFATYEGGGQGLGWSDVWVDAFPVGAIMIMLVWDTLLYSVLAWYLEAVLPGQYGPRLPLLFPLSASYWRHGYITGGLDIRSVSPLL